MENAPQNYFEHVDEIKIYQHSSTKDDSLIIIVLTSKKEMFENKEFENDNFENDNFQDNIPDRYADELKYWQPYKDNSIDSLLDEFNKNAQINLQVCFLDKDSITEEIRKKIKANKKNIILLADAFSLYFSENKEIAKMYDETDKGTIKACLVPLCNEYSDKQKEFANIQIRDTFKDLIEGWETEFHKSYTHIELDIPNKTHFFRRLANIAFYKGITEKEIVAIVSTENKNYQTTNKIGSDY